MILQAATTKAQKNDQIKYVLPDNVETFIDSSIRARKASSAFYFLLNKDSVYSISIGSYNKKDEKNILKWVKQTNRFLIVNKKVYPLIFDYDLKFATVDSNIGEFGKREGNIKRVSLMLHGLTIFFKSDGTIIKTENW